MKRAFIALGFIISLVGCVTSGSIKEVSIGMTKEEVINVMGSPVSVSAQGATEYLNYSLREQHGLIHPEKPYFVRLINGKVESFGRTGDFDSTKTPTVRLESDQTVRQDVQVRAPIDVVAELKKYKELKDSGVITEEEFQAKKKMLLERN